MLDPPDLDFQKRGIEQSGKTQDLVGNDSLTSKSALKSKPSTLFQVRRPVVDNSSFKPSKLMKQAQSNINPLSNAALVKGINKIKISGLQKVAVGMEKIKSLVLP